MVDIKDTAQPEVLSDLRSLDLPTFYPSSFAYQSTSNEVILGVSGKDHPFPLYRQFGVPVALSTDDEGVSRVDLTHEYVRAVQTYGLSYRHLKQMVRTGLEHSFLPGESLWRAPDVFTGAAPPCAKDSLGSDKPSLACAAFLKSSEKAAQQWELERRFREFESAL